MAREILSVEKFPVGNTTLSLETVQYTWGKPPYTQYQELDVDLEGVADDSIAVLNAYRAALEAVSRADDTLQIGHLGQDDIFETLKESAAEVAEEAGVVFVFDNDGSKSEYTPASLWEESGSCEWETSAQEGYDYGWDL